MFIGGSPMFVKEKFGYPFYNKINNLLKFLITITDLMNR